MKKTYYGKVDLTGRKYNRLSAISKVEGTRSRWLCKCECGNYKEYNASSLINGYVKSCGCLEKECLAKFQKSILKHGMTETILYKKWCNIKNRCYNSNYKYYYRYGGRGITMCDEWQGEHGFENFAKWAYEAGYDDSKTGYDQSIDRIDMDGNYCPQNCKWSNQIEQVKNRSNSVLITDTDGESLTSVQFSLKHEIPPRSLFVYRRIKKGLNAAQILADWEKHERKK